MRRRRRRADAQVEAVLRDEPIPRGQLEDDDVAALRAAIELRAARTGADLPTSEVIDEIRRTVIADDLEAKAPRSFSRRALLAAGGAVAAGVAAGVAVDRTAIGPGTSAPARSIASGPLVPDDGEWVQVASVEQLSGGRTQRFSTPKLVGFVSQQNGNPVAVSGACTHLGCLLQANDQAGRLDCPCHRTAFSPDGRVVFSELASAPAPLPRINARSRDGNVEVFIPRQV